MKTLKFEDAVADEVSFYEDDTIERVRELIAIQRGRHPDSLFLQVLTEIPAGYYTTPKEWTDLFFRLSRDGRTVTEDVLKLYMTSIRPSLASEPTRAYTRDQWEEIAESAPIRKDGGSEWRILGTPQQPILPTPPRDVDLPTNQIPLPTLRSLFETMHPLPVSLLRVTDLPADASDAVKRVYFPYLRPDTPPNLDAVSPGILKSQETLAALLELPKKHPSDSHVSSSIVKAKWYIPLNATEISAPRAQLEQMFYGLTLSPTTPYVAYFTSATEGLRNKYYVKDPTNKEPLVNPKLIRGWYTMTQPQRRRPTLLLYRGDSRYVFQRIALGATSLTIDIRKEKGAVSKIEDLQAEANTWLQSLDAVVPFLDPRDIALDRWELSDLSLHAVYSKDEPEFDLLRFPCLRSIFSLQEGVFRLLRAEPSAESVSPQLLQAFQLLQDGTASTAEALAGEMEISTEEAASLLTQLGSEDLNVERALKAYPTIRFVSGRDVLIRFATNTERILDYVDILRIVLTRDSKDVNDVCPRRQETVEGVVSIPQEAVVPEVEPDEELMALLGVSSEAPPPVMTSEPTPPKKGRKLRVAAEQTTTQNYFNARLQALDSEMFKEKSYSATCEKARQVVVLTPEQTETIRREAGEEYTYENVPADERHDIPGVGTAICPRYWCMRDEIPLQENQLVPDVDDPTILRCPVCGGKVRPNDTVSTREYTVIKRESSAGRFTPIPKPLKKGTKAPCCYARREEKPPKVLAKKEKKAKGGAGEEAGRKGYASEATYILSEDATEIPKWRGARLSDDLAESLGITTSYKTTLSPRLEFGKTDVFRIGLDRPRDLIPLLELYRADKQAETYKVASPAERENDLKRCSFYATWTGAGTDEEKVKEIDKAYQDGTLDVLYELEYLSYVYAFAAILIDMSTKQVVCGFRKDISVPTSHTAVLFMSDVTDAPNPGRRLDVLGTIEREREKRSYITKIRVDAASNEGTLPLAEKTQRIFELHRNACSVGLPTVDDARGAFSKAGVVLDHIVVDPYGRKQAILKAGVAYLPFVPTTREIPTDTSVKPISFADLKTPGLLPTYESQKAFLATVDRPDLYGRTRDNRSRDGRIVEIETASGLRIPVQPTGEPTSPQTEVTETIQDTGEEMLVSGEKNAKDLATMKTLDYESELYEFLLFSIAKTIRIDVADPKYGDLRDVIVQRDKTKLKKALTAWYKAEAFDDKTAEAYTFLSKVRTPCGQLSKDTCKDAALCGWKNGCKVRVRTNQVNKDALLKRIETTLLTNAKQRALVLDNRFSPFFSTVLYLEMPNELITTS